MRARLHSIPTARPPQIVPLPRNGGLSENNSARIGIDSRDHAERYRKILGAVSSLDAPQHRASKTTGLLGSEARNHLRLLFVAVDRANRTEDNTRDSRERARLPQLHEHPVDTISLLAGVFEKQDSPVEARLERRANRRDQHRQA